MLNKDRDSIIMAYILFLVAALSDFIDGWYARKFNVETSLGRFFDPLADKILTTSAFLLFVYLDVIPTWMFLVIIIRDFTTTIMRVYGDYVKIHMKTPFQAKLKTAVQMIFVILILTLILIKSTGLFGFNPDKINNFLYSGFTYYFMLLLTIFTFWTLLEYIFQNKSLIIHFWSGITKKKFVNE
jgi:CDP-diacylglycerol--glycerol-3-phosphate 3-phosphatidyltransferase